MTPLLGKMLDSLYGNDIDLQHSRIVSGPYQQQPTFDSEATIANEHSRHITSCPHWLCTIRIIIASGLDGSLRSIDEGDW